MSDIGELKDNEIVRLIESRWQESVTLHDIVEKTYKKNLRIWKNDPEWLDTIPNKKSKARDNRTFLAVESVINTLTGRPSKPNTIPANETDEAKEVANDLQEFFLAKYRDLRMKAKMRKGLRHLFFSRLLVFKVIWDPIKDDFDVVVKDPRNIRLPKTASSMYDADFVGEEIPDTPLRRLLELFPDKEKEILKKAGYDATQALIDNPRVTYKEMWLDGYVIWEFQGEILGKDKHPYWDWDGVLVNESEQKAYFDPKNKAGVSGKRRRRFGKDIRSAQGQRAEEMKKGGSYENYLYNHFDRPIAPYVFGTALDIDDSPVGETSLMEQVSPLQYEVDKRKRQISDNADLVTGRWKVDTDLVNMQKGEAQNITNSTGGVIYGSGVRFGVELMSSTPLPAFVFQEMNHSIEEIDNIFGTQPTFRGEGGGGGETATGRAILREQSFQRLDEMIDLVDALHHQLYSWWFQMIKVRYTEEHLVKPLGAVNAEEVVSLTRDDLQEGIELNIIPGQIVPEDRMFKAERAKEEAQAGLIDPVTYFEETGRDNPMELAKRLVLYQLNPLSILDLTPEDQQAVFQAQQFMAMQQIGDTAAEGLDQSDPKAAELAQLNRQVQEMTSSPEFQQLPQEEQSAAVRQIRAQYDKIISSRGQQPQGNQ